MPNPNDKCPCGSGKMYKDCCGKKQHSCGAVRRRRSRIGSCLSRPVSLGAAVFVTTIKDR